MKWNTVGGIAAMLLMVGGARMAWAQDVKGGAADAASGGAQPKEEYRVVERGPHHRRVEHTVWETTEDGSKVLRTNSYVELSTGMHYESGGQWVESNPAFEIDRDGYAVAGRGRHQVRVAPNINSPHGVVELTLPDGKVLRSAILGLNLFDCVTGKAAQVAAVQDATGELTADNEITFFNCFEGLSASVRIRNEAGQFHQDVVLDEKLTEEQLARFGFEDPSSVRVEIWTEFINPPEPSVKSTVVRSEPDARRRERMAEPDTVDHFLEFAGAMMPRGKAFAGEDSVRSAPVFKQWLRNSDGRVCLVESAAFTDLRPLMEKLPPSKLGAALPRKSDGKMLARRLAPERRAPGGKAGKRIVGLMAANDRARQAAPQLVIDYVVLPSTLSSYTFQGDTTYVVTNSVSMSGTTTIEGNTVIKYSANPSIAPCLCAYGPVKWETARHRPAVFTSVNDNSVGATISGSTGSPAIVNAICIEGDGPLGTGQTWGITNARVAYAYVGFLAYDGKDMVVKNCQFVNCAFGAGVPVTQTPKPNIRVSNVLFTNCACPLYACGYAVAENVTAVGYTNFCLSESGLNGLALTNCLTVGSGTWVAAEYGNPTLPTPVFDHTASVTDSTGLFQTADRGKFYLAADSPYRNAGTTNISADLLADLRQTTTYPPIVLSNCTISASAVLNPTALRDTDTPDYGFHYDPLDYVFRNVTLSGSCTLVVTNGAAVGVAGSYGVTVNSGGKWVCGGGALQLNTIARTHSVQDGPWESSNRNTVVLVAPYSSSEARFGFTIVPSLAGGDGGFQSLDSPGLLSMRDCQFWGGSLNVHNANDGGDSATRTFQAKNNLFHRTQTSISDCSGLCLYASLYNNLHYGGSLTLTHNGQIESGAWVAQNNLFDQVTITCSGSYTVNNSYNGYVNTSVLPNTSGNNQSLSSFTYATGSLGRFYQPTTSALIGVGSTTAAAMGLYHYTVKTSNVKEGDDTPATIDIGFHYVAVSSSGCPVDTDGEGLPDYLEDADGDGTSTGDPTETNWQSTGNGSMSAAWLQVFTPWKQ